MLVTMAPDHDTSGLRSGARDGRRPSASSSAIRGSSEATQLRHGERACGGARLQRGCRVERDGIERRVDGDGAPPGCSSSSISPRSAMRSVSRSRGRRSASSVRAEDGDEEVECPLPVLVTVTAGVVERRYPSFKSILGAKSKPVDVVTLDDVHVDAAKVGTGGARQTIVSVTDIPSRRGGEIFVEDASDAAARLVTALEAWGAI